MASTTAIPAILATWPLGLVVPYKLHHSYRVAKHARDFATRKELSQTDYALLNTWNITLASDFAWWDAAFIRLYNRNTIFLQLAVDARQQFITLRYRQQTYKVRFMCSLVNFLETDVVAVSFRRLDSDPANWYALIRPWQRPANFPEDSNNG